MKIRGLGTIASMGGKGAASLGGFYWGGEGKFVCMFL